MAQEIKPTRSELIKLKRRIDLAKSGYNLLKKKRDGLILEFFEVLKKAKTVRKELVEEYKKALRKMNIARAYESDLKIKALALGVVEKRSLKLETKNIMGVIVPEIEYKYEEKGFFDRGYSIISSSSKIDEAAAAYNKVIHKIVKVAEIETSLKRLLQEIEKTKRRVNALDYIVIPGMEETKKFITLRLEEMERENIFRMKRIKA